MTSRHEKIAVYVGTYHKYNNGSIMGAWLTINDFKTPEDFWSACRRLHSDERDPEFMFQDYELPDELGGCITESYIDTKTIFEYLSAPVPAEEIAECSAMSKAELKDGKAAWLALSENWESADYQKRKCLTSLVLTGGERVLIEKPSMKTSFCFGYGQNGISTEEDFQDAAAARDSMNQFSAFLAANLRGLKEELQELLDGKLVSYCCQKYTKVVYVRTWRDERRYEVTWRSEYQTPFAEERLLTPVDLHILARGKQAQIADLEKRCKTYWKRFGASKLHTWTYLVD